jgi:hypothetical protein
MAACVPDIDHREVSQLLNNMRYTLDPVPGSSLRRFSIEEFVAIMATRDLPEIPSSLFVPKEPL